MLAGVSVDYYTRLERGNVAGVSETVLEALARALQLDDVERAHLFDLARAAHTSAPRRRRRAPAADPAERAAHARRDDRHPGVRPERPAGHPRREPARPRALLPALRQPLPAREQRPVRVPRSARRRASTSTGRPSRRTSWPCCAREAGRDPYDRDLSDLVGELSTRSEPFRTLWAAHNVRKHDTGVKRVHHPLVGDLTFTYESMELAADRGLTMFVYTAEPGSRSEEALNLLASWTATPDEEIANADHEEQPRDRSRAE